MKLTFVHDGPLFFDAEGNYYEFAYHELYERYSFLADDITFLIRTKAVDALRHYTKVPNQIKVINVPNFKSPKTFIKNIRKANDIISNQIKNTDIVVLRTQSSIADLALRYVRKYKKPYIVECVGCSWDTFWNLGFIGKLVAPYMFFKQKAMMKTAPYAYYVTKEFLQSRYPSTGKKISCSNVVLDKHNDELLTKRIKRIDQLNTKKEIIIGTAAAIDTKYKGQEYVIKALPQLLSKGYKVVYKLAGGLTGQSENTYLKDLSIKLGVSDKVVFCGSLSSAEMKEYYDSLDLYIQPSKQEGLPRSVIEAMSRGCPVIGTNLAGIPELIDSKCLFKKANVNDIIHTIEKMMDKDVLKEQAKANYMNAQQYERDVLVKKREEFYSDFLKSEFNMI